MNENIQALIQKITESEELQAKFAAVGSPEEAYELARTIQEGFPKEEFVEAMTALSAAEDGGITDADLAAAAGGDMDDYDNLPDSVKQTVQSAYSAGTGILVASRSIVKSASVVSESIADSATEVANSVVKSATEVANSVSKATKEVGKATKKAFSI